MIKIPYLNTRIETDLVLTFLLTPLWWVSGMSCFVYHLVPILVLIKILARSEGGIQVSKPIVLLLVFSIAYLASIGINVGARNMQRIFASLNNYSMILMGFFIMLGVYNCDPEIFFRKFLLGCRVLCFLTCALGIFFLILWSNGVRDLEIKTALASQMPALLNYPYFYNFLMMTTTMIEPFSGEQALRLTIYSRVPTSTGGLMLMLIPMMMAYYELHKRKGVEYGVCFIAAITILIFSFSRAAILGFVFSWIVIYVLEKGVKAWLGFIYGLTGLVSSGFFLRWIEWILDARKSSTVGRIELYEQAFRILLEENPLMGIGVRLRDDFTLMAVGSHSMYMEILFVSGFIGFFLFLIYQGSLFKNLFSQKKFLKNPTEKILWRYLGMSFIALNVWVITDSLLGLPFTAYGYHLVAGAMLLLGRWLVQRPN